ncbi:MAG: alkyl sulfatase C-terminal domain-containing protein [Burkholderiaceae bacterium]
MGQVTTAANTRSWFLTQANELEGKIDTSKPPFKLVNAAMVKQMPALTYVNGLRFILPPALSAERAATVHLRFSAPDNAFTLRLRNGVVQILAGVQGQADSTLQMSFDTWARLVGREAKARALLDSADIMLEGDRTLGLAVLAVGGPIEG